MASSVRAACVSDEPLSVDRLLALVLSPPVGGVALFLGVVRDHDNGAAVLSLDYTKHPTAEQVLRRCAERVAADYDITAVAVEHRVGHLEVGDLAVVVAVAAVHRGPALAACTRLIEVLKEEVPIWKEQHFASGKVAWVGLPGDDAPAPADAQAGAPAP
jgi:molybdopterin synthase catalytic subunit